MEQLVACWTHSPEAEGSSPSPGIVASATSIISKSIIPEVIRCFPLVVKSLSCVVGIPITLLIRCGVV